MGLADTVARGLAELCFPTRCAGCDAPGSLLCDACQVALPLVDAQGACPYCGAPYGHIVCTECWEMEFAFSGARAVGSLERPLSRAITLYKDGGERRLAITLAEMAVQSAGEWAEWASCVVPVPATHRALKKRGFDHVALVAQHMSRLMAVPVLHALQATGARDMRELGRDARKQEVLGAFTRAEGLGVPSRVLLVDDVFTTGSTLDAATEVLLSAGADDVRSIVLARAW